MKFSKILMAGILSVGLASANETLKVSMDTMQTGIEQVQLGFINNDANLIKTGLETIRKGNALFSKESVIRASLPANKKHMTNVAVNASKRITADATIIELNLDDKAYTKAADGYSDMLNACSRCHGIVRNW